MINIRSRLAVDGFGFVVCTETEEQLIIIKRRKIGIRDLYKFVFMSFDN